MKTKEITREEKELQEQIAAQERISSQEQMPGVGQVSEQVSEPKQRIVEAKRMGVPEHATTEPVPVQRRSFWRRKAVMFPEPESKYVQQHLANERTFLAWIRTTVSIMGVGLVTTSLHFELSTNFNMEADNIIKIVGYATLLLGVIMLAFSVYSYLEKRKGINDGSFRSSNTFVVFMTAFMALIVFLFGMYLFKSY